MIVDNDNINGFCAPADKHDLLPFAEGNDRLQLNWIFSIAQVQSPKGQKSWDRENKHYSPRTCHFNSRKLCQHHLFYLIGFQGEDYYLNVQRCANPNICSGFRSTVAKKALLKLRLESCDWWSYEAYSLPYRSISHDSWVEAIILICPQHDGEVFYPQDRDVLNFSMGICKSREAGIQTMVSFYRRNLPPIQESNLPLA